MSEKSFREDRHWQRADSKEGKKGKKGCISGWLIPFFVVMGFLILNQIQMAYSGVNLNPLDYLYEWLGIRSPRGE